MLALIGALPLTLTAMGNIVVSLRNGRKTDAVAVTVAKAATQAESASQKADDLALGQKEIHILVNSNLSKVKADLEEAKDEIRALRALISKLAVDPDHSTDPPR